MPDDTITEIIKELIEELQTKEYGITYIQPNQSATGYNVRIHHTTTPSLGFGFFLPIDENVADLKEAAAEQIRQHLNK